MKRFVNGVEADLEPGAASVTRVGDRLFVRTSEGSASALVAKKGDQTLISYKGRTFVVERAVGKRAGAGAVGSGEMVAPLPGQVVDVLVAEGDEVKLGQKLLVIEAMKTQQPFLAPFDGVVASLPVKKGSQVAEGQLVVKVEALV